MVFTIVTKISENNLLRKDLHHIASFQRSSRRQRGNFAFKFVKQLCCFCPILGSTPLPWDSMILKKKDNKKQCFSCSAHAFFREKLKEAQCSEHVKSRVPSIIMISMKKRISSLPVRCQGPLDVLLYLICLLMKVHHPICQQAISGVSYPKILFQSEAKCKTIVMIIFF